MFYFLCYVIVLIFLAFEKIPTWTPLHMKSDFSLVGGLTWKVRKHCSLGHLSLSALGFQFLNSYHITDRFISITTPISQPASVSSTTENTFVLFFAGCVSESHETEVTGELNRILGGKQQQHVLSLLTPLTCIPIVPRITKSAASVTQTDSYFPLMNYIFASVAGSQSCHLKNYGFYFKEWNWKTTLESVLCSVTLNDNTDGKVDNHCDGHM